MLLPGGPTCTGRASAGSSYSWSGWSRSARVSAWAQRDPYWRDGSDVQPSGLDESECRTWQPSVPTTGLMHSDHRQPGWRVIRAALAVSPMRTMFTLVLSGVRTSSGESKSPAWNQPFEKLLLVVPVPHGPRARYHGPWSEQSGAALLLIPRGEGAIGARRCRPWSMTSWRAPSGGSQSVTGEWPLLSVSRVGE